MVRTGFHALAVGAAAVGLLLFVWLKAAAGIPSFARQAGLSCNACHTLFPELTPLGRMFKLGGYVLSKSDKLYEFPPPVAGVLMTSFTHTGKKQPSGSVEDTPANLTDSTTNNFFFLPKAIGGYYGGKIFYKLGALVQGTYSGVDDDFFLDITDIRFGTRTAIGGKDRMNMIGVTLNNTPSLEDVWNSTPAWGFPHEMSDVAPTPAAAVLIDGGLDQQVGGLGAYYYWNDLIYAGVTVYRTADHGIAEFLGVGTPTDTVVDGLAPYWRVALQHKWGKHSLEVGTFGIVADVFPEGREDGPTDRFTDIALDAQYQYITGKFMLTAQTALIHEEQDLDASFALGNAANRSNDLDTFKVNVNAYYRSSFGLVGGSVGYFRTTGNDDAGLYAPSPVDGSRTGSPDSDGFILEADYLPFGGHRKFFSPRFTLQYILYNEFNGSDDNYDGFGRDASDNNTLFFLVWMMF
jgi:hypothetical protein